MENKYNVGEIVEILNPDSLYSSYSEMFRYFNFLDQKENSPHLTKEDLVLVNGISIHPIYDVYLYACTNKEGEEFIIEEKGLQKSRAFKRNLNIAHFVIGGYDSKVTETKMDVGCKDIPKTELVAVIKTCLMVGFIKMKDIKP